MFNKFYPLYKEGELDPQSESILQLIADSNLAPLKAQTPEQVRRSFFEKEWLGEYDNSIVKSDFLAEGESGNVPVRVYNPLSDKPLPVIIFYHGGGFVVGRIEEFDSFCSYLAAGSGCVVASVDYRLAPEHKHPVAVDDAWNGFYWISNNAGLFNGDASKIALAGDSAGANLSLVTAIEARNKGYDNVLLIALICPWANLSSTGTKSYELFGRGLWLSEDNICWYRGHYLRNTEQAKTPAVSPLLAESFKGLPKTIVLTAEFDVLLDEGENLAKRLKEEGVDVKYSRYDGMLHDFVTLPGLFDRAQTAIDEICSSVKAAFNR
jgi:acetyl esterase